jgi:tRNA-dihydrouridine synthase
MIGRALVGNPWLLERARRRLAGNGVTTESPASLEEIGRVVIRHAGFMAEFRGEPRGIIEFRKHFVAYFRGVPGVRTFRQKAMTVTRSAELEDLVRDWVTRREVFSAEC